MAQPKDFFLGGFERDVQHGKNFVLQISNTKWKRVQERKGGEDSRLAWAQRPPCLTSTRVILVEGGGKERRRHGRKKKGFEKTFDWGLKKYPGPRGRKRLLLRRNSPTKGEEKSQSTPKTRTAGTGYNGETRPTQGGAKRRSDW